MIIYTKPSAEHLLSSRNRSGWVGKNAGAVTFPTLEQLQTTSKISLTTARNEILF